LRWGVLCIIADDVLYLKGDEYTKEAYGANGMAPFIVPSGRAQTLSYFEVPGEWLDDPDQLMAFGLIALGAANRAQVIKDVKKNNRIRRLLGRNASRK